MSKCYVTWDGDFKWGGPDDMYMGMLSGGLLGMSRRWWIETGGYDDQMLGWGGENIDQGVRMWVCGGEIVAAPNSQVAHMWRSGSRETAARYHHVGDTMKNRARAVHAWFGEFSSKLDDFPEFANRKRSSGDHWFGDMGHFQKVKDRLAGCRPFAWYLRRFKAVYEDGGILPPEVFMLREETSGKCLLFQGRAGTSGSGRDGIKFANCDENNHRFFWHLGNVNHNTGSCCSGLRAWNTDQCLEGQKGTGICDITGANPSQHWSLQDDGQLRHKDHCLGLADGNRLVESPCIAFRSRGGARFTKQAARKPLETELYEKAQAEHPETFELLNQQLEAMDQEAGKGPAICRTQQCVAMVFADNSGRCLDNEGVLVASQTDCTPMLVDNNQLKLAENNKCLDSWSDSDVETWGFYECHGGDNQRFSSEGPSRFCSLQEPHGCFQTHPWPLRRK